MTTPKALREMCEGIIADSATFHINENVLTVCRALQDRLSGEAVTPDVREDLRARMIKDFVGKIGVMVKTPDFDHDNIYCTAIDIAEFVLDDVLSLLPAGMDTGWLDIESAPKDGSWIMVTGKDYGSSSDEPPAHRFTRWIKKTVERWEQVSERRQELVTEDESDWDYCNMTPTHWRPLPESST